VLDVRGPEPSLVLGAHGTSNFLPKAGTPSMRRSENSCGSKGAVVGSYLTGSGLRPSAARISSGMAPWLAGWRPWGFPRVGLCLPGRSRRRPPVVEVGDGLQECGLNAVGLDPVAVGAAGHGRVIVGPRGAVVVLEGIVAAVPFGHGPESPAAEEDVRVHQGECDVAPHEVPGGFGGDRVNLATVAVEGVVAAVDQRARPGVLRRRDDARRLRGRVREDTGRHRGQQYARPCLAKPFPCPRGRAETHSRTIDQANIPPARSAGSRAAAECSSGRSGAGAARAAASARTRRGCWRAGG
jgi:hypothetical protein